MTSVPSVLRQSLKRLRLSHGSTPSVATGGARGGTSWKTWATALIARESPRAGCTSS